MDHRIGQTDAPDFKTYERLQEGLTKIAILQFRCKILFRQYYNKEYRNLIESFLGRGVSIEIHYFHEIIDIGDFYPLASKTGGKFYYYPKFDLSQYPYFYSLVTGKSFTSTSNSLSLAQLPGSLF